MTTAVSQIKVPLCMTPKEINLGTIDVALLPALHQRKRGAERKQKAKIIKINMRQLKQVTKALIKLICGVTPTPATERQK